MNLPVKPQLELRDTRKIHFRNSFMYVCPIKIDGVEFNGVLLQESHSNLRGRCYQAIWRYIRHNENLRRCLTNSENHVTLTQVIDTGGFGVITVTVPEPGHFVTLTWHPRIDGKLSKTGGFVLGTCNLGRVISPPEQAA